MAYINQAQKAIIAAELKKVVPAGWKYTLSIHNHTSLIFTLFSAPVDLLEMCNRLQKAKWEARGQEYSSQKTEFSVNNNFMQDQVEGPALEIFQAIFSAMNCGNHDNSDTMTDYYDVGWYVNVNVGRWDHPFVVTEQIKKAA